MILNVVLVLAGLAVIYGAIRNGFYGAIATFFFSTIAAVVALTCYYPVSDYVIAEYFPGISDYGEAIAFMGLFVVVLFVCQLVARAYLTDRVKLAKAFDVIGSFSVGLLNAIIIAGVLSMGYLMLPSKASSFYLGGSVFAGLDVKFVKYTARIAKRLGATSERMGGKEFNPTDFVEGYKKKFTEVSRTSAPYNYRRR